MVLVIARCVMTGRLGACPFPWLSANIGCGPPPHPPRPADAMDFIFMLPRNDRTIEDAASLVDAACELGVRHIGFKDVGVPLTTMREVTERIRQRGGVSYLEVVSTTSESVAQSLAVSRGLEVDRGRGGG